MKKLTRIEFQDRVLAVARARKIFIHSGLTNNITKAFELYQEVLAEQERPLTLESDFMNHHPTLLDEFIAPKCPDCGLNLRLRRIDIPKGKQNVFGWRSAWLCLGPECIHEEYMETPVEEILATLTRKPDEEGGDDIG